ncbi:hypothetical protein [Sphaerimonospora thailandensis]|uniref:Uncharacterized protein n=1 Tax=Sphaerimonospora thailandensis TaxID=795644 RepID=A0A8J3RBP9_9ACTN|nr:hypothetical protein [Sphaerimonospora thailandensis]GIH70884.1 hypothetical protein Mth01_31370 [Sphaerimonospora thailandensis]
MNSPTGPGDLALDPGQGMVWVDDHGAHLVDYASHHLDPDRSMSAVAAALTACARHNESGNIATRARLLAAVRSECANYADSRVTYRPGPGPGTPDDEAVRRAWSLVDPFGAETLRLLYRHELPLRDLSYVLALSIREVGRLVVRTQDIIEILVSGLDGLARGRPICPDLGPLVSAVFPAEPVQPVQPAQSAQSAAEEAGARTALLRHIVTCLVCKRPINIRYTVPQILSHPPITALSPEVKRRLTEIITSAAVLPPSDAAQPPGGVSAVEQAQPVHRPPASFGMPLAAPVAVDPAPSAPPRRSPVPPLSPPPVVPSTPTGPVVPYARGSAGGGGPVVGGPVVGGPVVGGGAETPLYDALLSQIRARTIPAGPAEKPRPKPESGGTADPSDASGGAADPSDARIPQGAPALSSFTVPNAAPASRRNSADLGRAARTARHALPRGREHDPDLDPDLDHDLEQEDGASARILEMISRMWALLRATAIRVVITVVAGAAGTLAGINLLAPADQPGEAAGSLRPSAAGATVAGATVAGDTASENSVLAGSASAGTASTGSGASTPTATSDVGTAESGVSEPGRSEPGGSEPRVLEAGDGGSETVTLAVGGLRIQSVVELDDFGRGGITLSTTSEKPLKWRITANDLVVKPSSGTLRPGRSDVISVRAQRVRYWCGPPPPAKAPLVLHGPTGSKSATVTVRWRTC